MEASAALPAAAPAAAMKGYPKFQLPACLLRAGNAQRKKALSSIKVTAADGSTLRDLGSWLDTRCRQAAALPADALVSYLENEGGQGLRGHKGPCIGSTAIGLGSAPPIWLCESSSMMSQHAEGLWHDLVYSSPSSPPAKEELQSPPPYAHAEIRGTTLWGDGWRCTGPLRRPAASGLRAQWCRTTATSAAIKSSEEQGWLQLA